MSSCSCGFAGRPLTTNIRTSFLPERNVLSPGSSVKRSLLPVPNVCVTAATRPFNASDPNYAALLRFTSGVYNSTMTTMLKADENLLRARAVDRLPQLLERIAEEERKRHARQLGIDAGPDGAA